MILPPLEFPVTSVLASLRHLKLIGYPYNLPREKQSSLLSRDGSDEWEKKFYKIDTWSGLENDLGPTSMTTMVSLMICGLPLAAASDELESTFSRIIFVLATMPF